MSRYFNRFACAMLLMIGLLCGCAALRNAKNESSAPSSSSMPASSQTSSAIPIESQLITDKITSQALAENIVGENTERNLMVYLTATYSGSDTRYPVVYYLHGFGEPPGLFVAAAKNELDSLFADGNGEFIMVGVDGLSKSGGSFYANSPVTGNWEDYVVSEVVSSIDTHYRTLPDSASRGICGFSMGGFGAMNLALKHPDVYGAAYAMSPSIAVADSFKNMQSMWNNDETIIEAYGQAFAPTPDKQPYYKMPVFDGTAKDNAIINEWVDGCGNWDKKFDAYLAKNTPLRGFGFSYGLGDTFTWIPVGTEHFIGLLRENGIEPFVYTFIGGHTIPPNVLGELLVPFFRENLVR